MGVPRCPKCGCVLQIREDEDPYIDRYDRNAGFDPDDWFDWHTPWLGLVAMVSWIGFRFMPWVKRHRWCPRCRYTP